MTSRGEPRGQRSTGVWREFVSSSEAGARHYSCGVGARGRPLQVSISHALSSVVVRGLHKSVVCSVQYIASNCKVIIER